MLNGRFYYCGTFYIPKMANAISPMPHILLTMKLYHFSQSEVGLCPLPLYLRKLLTVAEGIVYQFRGSFQLPHDFIRELTLGT